MNPEVMSDIDKQNNVILDWDNEIGEMLAELEAFESGYDSLSIEQFNSTNDQSYILDSSTYSENTLSLDISPKSDQTFFANDISSVFKDTENTNSTDTTNKSYPVTVGKSISASKVHANLHKSLRPPLSFELGMVEYFNKGDMAGLTELVMNSVSKKCIFQLKDDSAYYQSKGAMKIVRYHQMILNTCPDAVLIMKKMSSCQINGLQTIRSKQYFIGTKIGEPQKKNKIKYLPDGLKRVKIVMTTCIDSDGKVVVYDDKAKSLDSSNPLCLQMLYQALNECIINC